MRRTLAVAGGALALGAATLVGGQLAAPTPAAAATVCQPPIWGPNYNYMYLRCTLVEGAQRYFLSADCTDGVRRYGATVRVHEQAFVSCGPGNITRYYIHPSS